MSNTVKLYDPCTGTRTEWRMAVFKKRPVFQHIHRIANKRGWKIYGWEMNHGCFTIQIHPFARRVKKESLPQSEPSPSELAICCQKEAE